MTIMLIIKKIERCLLFTIAKERKKGLRLSHEASEKKKKKYV